MLSDFLKIQFILWSCLLLVSKESGIRFATSPDWEHTPEGIAGKGYTLLHPNRNMEISLQYIPGCTDPAGCLEQVAGFLGIVSPVGSFDTVLNEQRIVLMKGFFARNMRPYRCLFAGIPANNGLYVIRVVCPEDCYRVHRDGIREILDGLKIDPV